MVINAEMPIVGIIEGSALKLENNKLSLVASELVKQPCGFLFKAGNKRTIKLAEELSFLL